MGFRTFGNGIGQEGLQELAAVNVLQEDRFAVSIVSAQRTTT